MAKRIKKLGYAGKERSVEINVPEGEAEPWGLDDRLTYVGKDIVRVDAVAKVTGQAKYTFDMNWKGMLVAKILVSPFGAGTLKLINSDKAAKMPGVKAVLLLKKEGEPVLHNGDELAAIAAETEEQAEDAVHAIVYEIEQLPSITTVAQATAPGARQVFPGKDNLSRKRHGGDDPDKAEKEALAAIKSAAKTVEATYTTEVQNHNSLETHGVVARFEKDGSVVLWASTQGTFGVKGDAVDYLKLPESKVRVIAEYIGGGFGSKFGIDVCGKVAVDLAKKTNRPVKCMLTREQEHLTGGNRPSSIQKMKAGVGKDGRITGVVVQTSGSGGIGGGAGCSNPAIYTFGKKYKVEDIVYTNAPGSRAFRAPGHPQGIFAVESFMDELAHAAGEDPIDFRKKNIEDHPFYQAQWELAAREIGWKEKFRKKPGADKGVRKRGVGMASSLWYQMGWPGSEVDVTINKDGSVYVMNGAQDIGTGTKTLLATIVGEELTLPPSSLRVKMGDTNLPIGPGSGGSSTAPGVGPAARTAGIKAKAAFLAAIAKQWKVEPATLSLVAGEVVGANKRMPFVQAARLLPDKLTVRGVRALNYEAYHKSVGGCQFAEVEVDTETGVIQVIKVVAVQDAGQPVSKLLFESQILGGVIQGLSYALHEERILDHRFGTQVNGDLLWYKIAGSVDMPEIVPIAFEVRNGGNNAGIMGLGEPPKVPTAAAIANAVFNATGARVRSLPMTPEKVLAALAEKDGKRGATRAGKGA